MLSSTGNVNLMCLCALRTVEKKEVFDEIARTYNNAIKPESGTKALLYIYILIVLIILHIQI